MSSEGSSGFKQPRGWRTLALVLAALIAAGALWYFFSAEFVFWYNLFYGFEQQKGFFVQFLGFGDAWASVCARLMQFLTAVGWIPLAALPLRRLTPQYMSIVFLGFFVIYILPPTLLATLGGGQCFNQTTGQGIKWYVIDRDGSISLYDSPGYDKFGVKKSLVTTEICEAWNDQQKKAAPNRLTGDPRRIEFFYPSGQAKVWYDIDQQDGSIRLFDHPGHDPETNQLLLPVTPKIRQHLVDNVVRGEKLAQEQQAADEAAWTAADGNHKIEDYNRYLRRFPNGAHADAARNAIAGLNYALSQPAPAPTNIATLSSDDERVLDQTISSTVETVASGSQVSWHGTGDVGGVVVPEPAYSHSSGGLCDRCTDPCRRVRYTIKIADAESDHQGVWCREVAGDGSRTAIWTNTQPAQ